MAILLATLDLSSAEILRYYAYALVSARCLSPHWITTNARRGAAILYAHGRWFYYPAHPGTSPLRVAASKHVNLFWTDLLLTPVIFWGTAGTGSRRCRFLPLRLFK